MIVQYLRSSSMGTLSWCEHKYFCSYVLGIPEISNKAADKGTIVHKVMELFGQAKKAKQNDQTMIQDELFGEFNIKRCNNIPLITTEIFNLLTEKIPHHSWVKGDLKDCINHVKNITSFNNGMFDPRKRDIIDAEKYFDISINEKWAKYNFDLPHGKLNGTLAIKGTIDLVTKIDNDTLEILDWKTGRYRTDWNTGKTKEYDDFSNDIQLRLYHYAASILYPQYKDIIITIFYVQAGGPYTIHFHKDDIFKTEQIIREYFEKIKRIAKPRLNVTWKCSRFCHYGKNKFDGSKNTICQDISNHVNKYGMHRTIENYGQKLEEIKDYKSGGGRENVK